MTDGKLLLRQQRLECCGRFDGLRKEVFSDRNEIATIFGRGNKSM
jgi:hypothetical protein